MTKQEFLDELRMALSGKLGSAQVESHARYYEEYINAGFKDYMSKPIKSELLEKMLKKYIPKEKIEK